MARATWFCIDIECSGPVPALYDMISLGVVAVHHTPEGPICGASAYLEIRPEAPQVDPGAMAVNGLDLDRLRRQGLPRREALQALSAFVVAHTDLGSEPVFVGHNAPFDWSFVAWSYRADDLINPFGYKALDTKALATGVLGIHWLDSSKETLQEMLDLPAQNVEKVHRADYDAEYQALILVALLRRAPCLGDAPPAGG